MSDGNRYVNESHAIARAAILLGAFLGAGCEAIGLSARGSTAETRTEPGARRGGMTLYERFQDADPAVRVAAAIEAGQTKDPRALPYLVDRLTDSEPEVRLAAGVALRKATGEASDLRYHAPPEQREQAAARWRQRLKARRAGRAGGRSEEAGL